MADRGFSWLEELPAIRESLSKSLDQGLLVLRRLLCDRPPRGFEFELVGRLLGTIDVADVSGLPAYRVAVLSSHTSEALANAVRIGLLMEGRFGEVYEAPFGAYRQEILDAGSGLYGFNPDAVLIASPFLDPAVLLAAPLADELVFDRLREEVGAWRGLWDLLVQRLGVLVLQHLIELPEQELLGIAERRSLWTPSRFVQALNDQLVEGAPGVVKWIDVDRLAARVGRQNWHDLRLYHHARLGFSPQYLVEYTQLLTAALRAAWGTAKKVLVVDLDNTLWGGIIGDDELDGIRLGPDTPEGAAYESFCEYVKALGRRGVILGICSKNELANAAEVFDEHPNMPLDLADFAAVSCNWEDKATNLMKLANELNVDVSSLVFADDNPAECELIRQALPDVHTVLLDGDPALFVRKLDHQHLFESPAFSQEDIQRTQSYQARGKSVALEAEAPDLDTFLTSLDMRAQFRVVDVGDFPRLAQMEMKTNQFNMATRRLSAEQIQSMSAEPGTVTLVATLVDRFTDHGLVAYLSATMGNDKMLITDWLMSCRVFSRTLEQFMINGLAHLAVRKSVSMIEAVFRPTPKNGAMLAVFGTLGFDCVGSDPEGPWQYRVSSDVDPQKCYIVDETVSPPSA